MRPFYIILFFFISCWGFSQTLVSSLNKKTIALGEPDVYRIRIENLGGKAVVAAPKNELLPFHFEEISDSISHRNGDYERTIEFAVFEEGKFTIPAFDIVIGGEIRKTVPYEIEVVNPAKQGDVISDIQKNREIKLSVTDYWELYKWYLLAFLILLAVIIAIWQIIKYGKRRKSAPVVVTSETMKNLDTLKRKGYIERGEYRQFYVELIDISRRFLTQQYRIPAEVLLTEDLIAYMRDNQTISEDNERLVEEIFLRGDLVKFAKTFPDQQTMQQDFDAIRTLVQRSSKDLEFENLRKDV